MDKKICPPQRKKICIITDILIVGGVENVLAEALKVIHREYDVKVIVLRQTPEKEVTDKFPDNVEVVDRQIGALKAPVLFPWTAKDYFNKAMNGERFDYVITLKRDGLWACFTNNGKNKVAWCFNDYDLKYLKKPERFSIKRFIRWFCLHEIYRRQDMVWTVNERIANDLTEIFKLKNFYALPNPIDCDEIISKSEMPCDIEFDKNKLNVVILGRLSSEKGISRVLKAVSSGAFCGCRDYHLYVIGGGDNLEKIRSRLVELKIRDRVTMLGSKANPFPYLKQADLLICPSRYESFGLVMVEAMLLKVPVITTATSGGRYVTQDGRYAVCVENNDGALCEAVREYLSNPDSYRFSVEEAYEWARMHDTSRFADRLLYLLNKCQK